MTAAFDIERETLPALDYLPGGWMELRMAPAPRRAIRHEEIRALHGVVTGLVQGHDDNDPRFALFPYEGEVAGIGWALYVPDEEIALRLAGRVHDVDYRYGAVHLRCGPMRRWGAPRVPNRYATVMLRTITPVIVRAGGRHGLPEHQRSHTRASESTLLSTMSHWLRHRCGVAKDFKPRVRFLANDTRPQTVRLSGRYGAMTGWAGTVVMEASPGAHWLLKAAEKVGLGGRTAYGFGRVIVRELG